MPRSSGGRYHVDEEGNVSEEPTAPRAPLTEQEQSQARAVYTGMDLDRSGSIEPEELTALYAAGDPQVLRGFLSCAHLIPAWLLLAQAWFARLDRIRRDGKVSLAEFLAGLPELKPHRGMRSLKFTLRHLEKRTRLVATEHVAAAREAAEVEIHHYAALHPDGEGANTQQGPGCRKAVYQVLLRAARKLMNLYVDVSFPSGAKITQAFYYTENKVKDPRALQTQVCPVLPDAPAAQDEVQDEGPVVVRCKVPTLRRECFFLIHVCVCVFVKVPSLEAAVSLYFHASYPEDTFDEGELQGLATATTTAQVMVAGEEVNRAAVAVLRDKAHRAGGATRPGRTASAAVGREL